MNLYERGLFTSECRTDSCAFYVTQSCDVTQPITRPLLHSAVVTMMNLTHNPLQSSICDGHICWPTGQNGSWLQRVCFWKPVRFGRPPVSSTLWLSLHMPGMYVSTWTTHDSQHLLPEMIQRSRQSVFWWVDLGVVFACLSIVFCNNYEAVSNCLWAKHTIKQQHSRFSAGIWMLLSFCLSTIVSFELELFYYVRRKYDIKDKGNLST